TFGPAARDTAAPEIQPWYYRARGWCRWLASAIAGGWPEGLRDETTEREVDQLIWPQFLQTYSSSVSIVGRSCVPKKTFVSFRGCCSRRSRWSGECPGP